MSLLLDWYPTDAAVWFVARLFAEVAVVIAAAGITSRIALRRRAVARHALWLGVLISITAAPFVVLFVEQVGWTWSIRKPVVISEDLPTSSAPGPVVAARPDMSFPTFPDMDVTADDAVQPPSSNVVLTAEGPEPAPASA